MTPPDEVQKLAKELAEAITFPSTYHLVNGTWKHTASSEEKVLDNANLLLPILTAHFAARDAEVQRLREAVAECHYLLGQVADYNPGNQWHKRRVELAKKHAALHPNHQEPSE